MTEFGDDKHWWDRAGMLLSGLCLVHCVTTAAIVTLLASAGGVLLDPRIHEVGLLLAIGLAAVALGRGLRIHRAPVPALVGVTGLAMMGAALMVPHGAAETLCTIVGVAVVALGHTLNRRALTA